MEPYRETRRVLAGAYLGGLALILGSVLVTSARLSRPVNELTRRVAKIAEGDKDETVSDIQSDDEIGDLATAFGTMQEKVSDREERLLKARETTLTELLESAPEAMLITGADGTVCRTNSKAEALFGYGSGQLGGIEISRLLPEPAAGGRPAGRRHDGSEFPAETSVSPFQDPAGPMEIRVVRDISERLAREAELLDAREAAEAATRAKGEFLSHMSHELRTPLNGVLGYAQILMRDPSSTPSQRENLDAIVSCSDHLLGLINDVLDLSRIEAGRVEVDLKPTDLHRVVQGVADIVGQRARGAGLEFTTEIGDGLPRHVVTDGPKLRQVLVNLLGNAVKFTPSGSVKLSVHERPEGKLRIEVADTGIGMTDRELAEIFDPFKQVEAGKAAGGTGLGLAISRHLCESLGGELTATSVPREGSTFSVTLPLERAEGVAQLENIAPRGEAGLAPAAPLRLAREGSSTVLIVDDRESNRDVLSKMLKSSGFATETAVNGAEALEMLRTDPARFDLVLMDLAMPVLDGTSTVKAIRADPQLRGLAVIAVTASAGPDFREQAVADGFDDALSKPLRFEALADSLRRHTRIDFAGESESESGSSRAPAAAAREPAGSAAELPASAVDALTGALKIRSLTAINQLASELAADASTAAAGKEIQELAKKFDFKGLEALLERMG